VRTLYIRLLISTGIAVFVTIVVFMAAWLLLQAEREFGWSIMVIGWFSTTVLLFVVDTVTSAFTPPQQ